MTNKENRQNKTLSTALSLMKPIITCTLHIFNLRLKWLIDIIQLRYTTYNDIPLNLCIRFLSKETDLSLFSSDWSDNVANTITMNIAHGHILIIYIVYHSVVYVSTSTCRLILTYGSFIQLMSLSVLIRML